MQIPIIVQQGHWEKTKVETDAEGNSYEVQATPNTPWVSTSYPAILIDTKIIRNNVLFVDWAVIVKMDGTIAMVPLHTCLVENPQKLREGNPQ